MDGEKGVSGDGAPFSNAIDAATFGMSYYSLKMPSCGCRFSPGSPEKIAVLAQRMQDGVYLWHPDDLTAFDSE